MLAVRRRRAILRTVRQVPGVASMVLRLASYRRRRHVPLLLAIGYPPSVPLLVTTMNLKSSPKKRMPKLNSRVQCRILAVRLDDPLSLIVTNMTPSKFKHKHTQRSSVLPATYMLQPQDTMSRSMISTYQRVRYYRSTIKTLDLKNLRLPASSSAPQMQPRTKAATSGLVRKMATCMSSTCLLVNIWVQDFQFI